MALTASPKREEMARFVASCLRGNPIVREASVHCEDGVFHVQVIVDTIDLEQEQAVRSLYPSVLDAFPELFVDLYVTNVHRISESEWRQLIHPEARQVEL